MTSTSTTNEPFVFHSSAARSRGSGGDAVVEQTRREIGEIVRELANISRQEIAIQRFTAIVCDRTLRAMSAEGVIIWQYSDSSDFNQQVAAPDGPDRFQSIASLGRVTESSIPTASQAAHRSMLTAIATDAQPVVVPPTPGATDSNVPANPTDVPVAVVPIDLGHGATEGLGYVIEVFLEPDGGIATQRGYLRFVCQVADLAGEYFRGEQLRTLVWKQSLAERVDRAIFQLHQHQQFDQLAAAMVDSIADLFSLDRVALCRIDETAAKKSDHRIIAVSHVESIDHHSDTAQQIIRAAQNSLSGQASHWFATESTKNPSAPRDDDGGVQGQLFANFVLKVDGASSDILDQNFTLVGYRTDHSDEADSFALMDFEQRELLRFAKHAVMGIKRVSENQRPGLLNFLRAGSPAKKGSPSKKLRWANRVKVAAMLAVLIGVLIIPVPCNVEAIATLRPADVQRISATRDAVVQSIEVQHGQVVRAGEVLMTLADPLLDQQYTTLMGRSAVLAEQQARLTEAMVDGSSSDFERFEETQSQRSITQEEIASVRNQLNLIKQTQQSLVIRSGRAGVVDAWQINEHLKDRPVQRGDRLLQVIATDSSWIVDAEVQQRRIDRVRRSHQAGKLESNLSLDNNPGVLQSAKIIQFGPAMPRSNRTENSMVDSRAAVMLGIDHNQCSKFVDGDRSGVNPTSNLTGTRARVVFKCGQVPLADLLVGDLYRDIRHRIGLHWGWHDPAEPMRQDINPQTASKPESIDRATSL